MLLLVGAVVRVAVGQRSGRDGYESVQHVTVGPAALHLHLDLAHWAADGLLAIFFLVAGLELKRELVVGELRDRQRAVLPIVAAVAGVVVPAVVYLAVSAGIAGGGAAAGRCRPRPTSPSRWPRSP